jgi:phosphoribosyl-ATP pyrophosphohydrolase
MLKNNTSFLEILFKEIKEKAKNDDPEKSYSAFLAHAGIENITKKIVEEAFEVSLAAIDGNDHKNGKEQIIAETADLFYHILVLLAKKDIELLDIFNELEKRNKTKNLSKKAIAKNKIKLKYDK